MEFKKLSDVTLAEATSENTNVLIEDNGEVKKVAMDQIKVPQEPQVQADWNEADESNPAFILNKPEKLGGYTYFAINSGGSVFRTENFAYPAVTETPNVTKTEFEDAYKSSPIMLIPESATKSEDLLSQVTGSVTAVPCVKYYLNMYGYPHVVFASYNHTTMAQQSLTFAPEAE